MSETNKTIRPKMDLIRLNIEFNRWTKIAKALSYQNNLRIDLFSASYSHIMEQGYQKLIHFCEKQDLNPLSMDVLDLGVGKGWSSVILANLFQLVLGLEIIQSGEEFPILRRARRYYWDAFKQICQNLTYCEYDGYNIPVNTASIDLVFAQAVFEHVGSEANDNEERGRWLAEISRVLRNSGILFISTCPNYYSYAEKMADLLRLPNHNKRFKRREIIELINEAGFCIESIGYTNPFIDFYPGRLQGVWNTAYKRLFKHIGKAICTLPTKYLAHHFRIIAVKNTIS